MQARVANRAGSKLTAVGEPLSSFAPGSTLVKTTRLAMKTTRGNRKARTTGRVTDGPLAPHTLRYTFSQSFFCRQA
jgi:hypothetical protein